MILLTLMISGKTVGQNRPQKKSFFSYNFQHKHSLLQFLHVVIFKGYHEINIEILIKSLFLRDIKIKKIVVQYRKTLRTLNFLFSSSILLRVLSFYNFVSVMVKGLSVFLFFLIVLEFVSVTILI